MDADVIIARAVEVFGAEEKATSWLDDPNRVLADATPRSLLCTPEWQGACTDGVWTDQVRSFQLKAVKRVVAKNVNDIIKKLSPARRRKVKLAPLS